MNQPFFGSVCIQLPSLTPSGFVGAKYTAECGVGLLLRSFMRTDEQRDRDCDVEDARAGLQRREGACQPGSGHDVAISHCRQRRETEVQEAAAPVSQMAASLQKGTGKEHFNNVVKRKPQ